MHHGALMRLTINLDEDLYAIGKGLAQAEDISISQAINRLLRRSTEANPSVRSKRNAVSGLRVSRGRRLITAADVRAVEQDELK